MTDPDTIKVAPVKVEATTSQTFQYLVYFFFGALEILLAFRFIFKLTEANAYNSFVSLVYGVTGVFVLPFRGIFGSTGAFEPSTLIAIAVYAIVAWGIVKLLSVLSGERLKEG
jgi:uncharacterized protein YggT (Ycf19 family)